MRLYAKIIKDTFILKEVFHEVKDERNIPFREALEECFLSVCRQLDIQVPIWLKKNTRELGAYRKTIFPAEQFYEGVKFDKLEIKLEQTV